MMQTTVPTPGTNKLTERLLAQGVKLDDHSTWPEGVWACEINNFGYSREWRFTPTWESPCGLLIHEHGDMWGETWVGGEFKCAENDNPLFPCPIPGKPCPHRLQLPPGINCQFHRTDREWNEEDSVERLARERQEASRRLWEEDMHKYPGWDGMCFNIRNEDLPDGTVRRSIRYRLYECIRLRCKSEQCVCRCGAKRDLRPANIFYDLYIERRFNEGLVPYADKKLRKGLKVFDKPIAWTDAEIALKIWQHDPDSSQLPVCMRDRLNAGEHTHTRDLSREAYFVRHHRYWDGHNDVELYVEIRNIRIAKNEQRDMLQDLRDVQNGITVVHDSDQTAAAKAVKSQKRRDYRIKKYAKLLADGKTHHGIDKLNDDMLDAVYEETARIKEKREAKVQKEAAKEAQITMFDMGGGN